MNAGNNRVLNALAYMYAEGEGVKQDKQKAWRMAEQAVQLGVQNAAHAMAYYYLEGKIVPRNTDKAKEILQQHLKQNPNDGAAYYALAMCVNGEKENTALLIELLKKSAELGEADAWESLADVYYRGVGVEKDYATAAAYVQKAAEEGRIAALVSLAAMYARGEGVPRDVVKAEELCRRAIEVDSSYAPAYRNMAVLLKERAKDDKSRAEVEHYLLCAAELNDVDCMVELAREYSSDAGLIRRNTPSAIRWCEASLKEYPESPELNCLLADNLCASPQCCKSRAFIHYSRAAALGEDRAVYKLGRAWEEGWAYEKGKRQPASRDNAAQFYAQAIELGCAEAGAALIRMADLGHTGVEISLSDWLNLLKHASDAGVKGCAAKLAAYYHPECGSQPNADISARWMKVAVERDATPVESVIELSD